ncbi:MAG: hypothetical protein D3917_18100, partial [Candidatus Electrothrix sp. AX5]|nr:hypothetical protein [Candidatus Electrothrix sp. AX5]
MKESMTSTRISEAAQQAWLEQLIHEFNYICSYYRVDGIVPSGSCQALGAGFPVFSSGFSSRSA